MKGAPRRELIKAVKGAVAGQTHVKPPVAGKLLLHIAQNLACLEIGVDDELSKRELEILRLLAPRADER